MNHKADIFVTVSFFITGMIQNTHPQNMPIRPLKAQGCHEAWKQQVANVLYETEFKDFFNWIKDKMDQLKSFTSTKSRMDFINSQRHSKYQVKKLKKLIHININRSKSFSDNLVFPETDQCGKFPSEQTLHFLKYNFTNSVASRTKRWMQYVEYFLGRVMEVYTFQARNSLAHWERFVRYMKHKGWGFKQISGITYRLYRQRSDCFTENTITVPIANIVKKESYPANYVVLEKNKLCCTERSCSDRYNCDPCAIIGRQQFLVNTLYVANYHTFIFTLDKYLKSFLQFHCVYFELVDLHMCSIGTLNINSILSGKVVFSLKYCGIYSNIPVHPPHKDVKVTVSMWLWVSHTIHFSFSIVSSLMQVFSLPISNFTKTLVWSLQLSTEGRYSELFEVKTDKYNVICILYGELKISSATLYNGPGSFSEHIHLIGNGSFQTASFCCLILFYSPNTLKDGSSNVLKYIFISNTNKKQIFIKRNSKFKVSCNGTSSSECVSGFFPDKNALVLQINGESNVNASINLFKSQFIQSSLCQHSGMAIYQIVNSTKVVSLATVCSHDNSLSARNVYAQGPKCLLVLYSHTEYGTFHAELTLSTTNCSLWVPSSVKDTHLEVKNTEDGDCQALKYTENCTVLVFSRHSLSSQILQTPKQFLQLMKPPNYFHLARSVSIIPRKNVPTTVNIAMWGHLAGM